MEKVVVVEGLTRYHIGELLRLYNMYIAEPGSGRMARERGLQKVVSGFGMRFTDGEASRAVQAFAGEEDKPMTFNEFVDFCGWYRGWRPKPEKQDECPERRLMKIAFGGLKDNNSLSDDGIVEMLKCYRTCVSENASSGDDPEAAGAPKKSSMAIQKSKMAEFMFTFLRHPTEGGRTSLKRLRQQMEMIPLIPTFDDEAKIVQAGDKKKWINIKCNIAVWNVLMLHPFRYVGPDRDIPSLDVFVELEFCGKRYRTKVIPAVYVPSLHETIEISEELDTEFSFFDATWWLQTRTLNVRVYAVHGIGAKVSYHLLGLGRVPLVSLLSGRDQRVTFVVNAESIVPIRPIPVIMSVTAVRDSSLCNKVAFRSAPLEQMVFGMFISQIRDGFSQRKITNDDFKTTCDTLVSYVKSFPDREFQVFGFDERNVAAPLCMFINFDDWVDAWCDKTYTKHVYISYVISLRVGSVLARDLPNVMQIRSLPAIEAAGRTMSDMERAILLCSIIQSLEPDKKKPVAYVCVGERQWQRYICVVCKKPNDQGKTESKIDGSMFCPNHVFSLDSFRQIEDQFMIPSVHNRLDGQQKSKLVDGPEALLINENPDTSVDHVTDMLDKNQPNVTLEFTSFNDVDFLPVTGWHGDAIPRDFRVGSVFNGDGVYLYRSKGGDSVGNDILSVDWSTLFGDERGPEWVTVFENKINDGKRARVYSSTGHWRWQFKRTWNAEQMKELEQSVKDMCKQYMEKSGICHKGSKLWDPPTNNRDKVIEQLRKFEENLIKDGDLVTELTIDGSVLFKEEEENNGSVLFDTASVESQCEDEYDYEYQEEDEEEENDDCISAAMKACMIKPDVRCLTRIIRHKTSCPHEITEELISSGMLSSGVGAKRAGIVVHPFPYQLFASSTWTVLTFQF